MDWSSITCAQLLYGKLHGPGAGAARSAKWAEARDLAGVLGLVNVDCDVRKMKNGLIKNQQMRSRGNVLVDRPE